VATLWTTADQCWTWSGFRITIQQDCAIQNWIRIGLDFEYISTGSDIQTALITAGECLIRACLGYKPDWIKYLDSATGLGLDWIRIAKIFDLFNTTAGPAHATLVVHNSRSVHNRPHS